MKKLNVDLAGGSNERDERSQISGVVEREVRIVFQRNSWFVNYVTRRKGQRYSAAQFDARDNSREKVVAWVKAKPNLKLVNEEE